MQQSCRFLSLLPLAVALGAPSLGVSHNAPPRQPVGIYYRQEIQPDTDTQVSNNVAAALTNSAISGILAVFAWSNISLTVPTNAVVGTNVWNLMDDVFGTVEQYN